MKCFFKGDRIILSNSYLVVFVFDCVMGAYRGYCSLINDFFIIFILWV